MMDYRSDVACNRCFLDRTLRQWIKEQAIGRGVCPWCGRKGHLIPLSKLSESFREIASLYDVDEGPDAYQNSEFISLLLHEDWQLFSEAILEFDLSQELAVSILSADLSGKERYDYPDYSGFFSRPDSRLENAWNAVANTSLVDDFRKPPSVKFSDRFPELMPSGVLEAAFEDMAINYEPKSKFYRARIHEDRRQTTRFTSGDLGAPPAAAAKAGRANCAGQPALYLANNKTTALAEVRPWKGAAVALAEVAIRRRLMLVDLTSKESVKSPFFVELLKWRVELAGLLYRLGDDMSRPVMPHEQDLLYRPTQLLALLIKSGGYDGCIYPSAMGSGKNLVLFDVEVGEVTNVDYFRIKRAAYISEKFSLFEEIYEEGPFDFALKPN